MRKISGKLLLSVYLGFILFFGAACTSESRSDESKVIFTNDVVSVRTKMTGLPESVKAVYLVPFTDLSSRGLAEIFGRKLSLELNRLGLVFSGGIKSSDAVVSGRLDSITIRPSDEYLGTNSGLLYTLNLSYSVTDREKNWIQRDQKILERILVADTNAFLENDVLKLITESAALRTAEAVVYGWQLSYSQLGTNILILGGKIETNYSVSRSESNR